MNIHTDIACPCSEIIMKSQGDVSKIRSKILIIKGNSVRAVCKSCGFEIPVPLKVDPDFVGFSGPDLILEEDS